MFLWIPLLAIPVVLYNVLAFSAGEPLGRIILAVTLPSGAAWSYTMADLVAMAGLVFLYVEIAKATKRWAASVLDHALSMILCLVCFVEFLAVPALGKTTFFLLTMMTLLDVIAGITIAATTVAKPNEDEE